MKFLVIVLLACVWAAEAGIFGHNVPGFGAFGQRGSHDSGRRYGQSEFGSSNKGFGGEGFRKEGIIGGHDRGYEESDFSQVTKEHKSSGHDIGGGAAFNSGGMRGGGFENQRQGSTNFGEGYDRGQNEAEGYIGRI